MHHSRFLEPLELRRLFTIDVNNFGAPHTGDRADDTSAIQAAINASAPGDTIRFAGGIYDVTKITLKGSRTYRGFAGRDPAIQRDFAANAAADTRDITITGFQFEPAGHRPGGWIVLHQRSFITDNVFSNIPGHAIKLTVGSDGVSIDRNVFINVQGYGCVEAYGMSRFSYSRNRVIDCAHGGHFLGPLADCKFNYNRMTGS